MPSVVIQDLLAEAPVPARGILSQTLSKEDGVELVLFAFAAGEQLSEHTAARPAIIHILSGEADLTVDSETHQAAAEMFRDHPHFTLMPGDSVEVMECLPMPGTPSRQ